MEAGALILGIGHPWRGDDAAGLAVAARLRARGLPALDHDGDGADLMERWQGRGRVVIVDAMRSGAPVGTVRRIDATAAPLPHGLLTRNSHLFGLAEAIETARALGRLPSQLILYGVEAASFDLGADLSAPVERSVGRTVDRIIDEVAHLAPLAPAAPALGALAHA